MSTSQTKVTIMGAGLVGTLLGIYLSKRKFDVHIFERRPDFRTANVDVGRSINLAVSERGWFALQKIGLDSLIAPLAIPMYGRMIHHENGTVKYQPYGKEGQAIYSISRKLFNDTLVNIAENEYDVSFHFNEKCWDINLNNAIAHFENTITGMRLNVKSDVIFGADGSFSTVRNSMMKTERYNYSQTYLDHGYKELTIPANPDGSHQIEKNALHIWPRGNYMLIALPNNDGTFTCTLFLPYKGDVSYQTIGTDKIKDFFKQTFPDALAIMPNLEKEYKKNPTSSLVTISCYPWCNEANVGLIGDAAHSMVPFFGQGMNCGFEDVRILDEIIEKENGDWENILNHYQESRKPNADAIQELARLNFIEMRDLVQDDKFLLRKKIEAKLHQMYPEKWTPLYSLVTFTHTSYARALKYGRRQDKILKKIMALPEIEITWETMKFDEFLADLNTVSEI